MTVAEVKARLAELLEISKKEADDVLWALNELCTEAVENGESVPLPGIGKLSCTVRAARMARNPRTGESVKVPAKVAMKFGLSTTFKQHAPSLKSKAGKDLLAAAEARQEAAAKRKRERERQEAKENKTSSARVKRTSKTVVKRKTRRV